MGSIKDEVSKNILEPRLFSSQNNTIEKIPVAKEVIDYTISLYRGEDPSSRKVGNNTRNDFMRGQLCWTPSQGRTNSPTSSYIHLYKSNAPYHYHISGDKKLTYIDEVVFHICFNPNSRQVKG